MPNKTRLEAGELCARALASITVLSSLAQRIYSSHTHNIPRSFFISVWVKVNSYGMIFILVRVYTPGQEQIWWKIVAGSDYKVQYSVGYELGQVFLVKQWSHVNGGEGVKMSE